MVPTLVIVSALIIAGLVCIVGAKRRRAAFAGRFPPISDAEFVARCRPGTNPEVALKVRRIIADAFAVEYERVHPSARVVGDLGVD